MIRGILPFRSPPQPQITKPDGGSGVDWLVKKSSWSGYLLTVLKAASSPISDIHAA